MKKIIVLLIHSCCMLAAAAQTDTVYKPVELPPGFTSQLNVAYTHAGEWHGRMDLYLPPKGKPSPVIINIHGGGWNHGVKESQTGFNTFFKASFAVANVEYRLTGQATAPAAIQDCRCALIYLINNAQALNIDVSRIVVMGSSSGGHLALMTGMLANDHRFDSNCPTELDTRVAAIIDKYGVTDVWDWGYGIHITSKSATSWLGARAKDREFAASVSPLRYIKKSNPPIFIVHGDADPTVPYQQSVELHRRLLVAGVPTKFITIPGGLHGKFSKEQNSEINVEIINFLRRAGVVE